MLKSSEVAKHSCQGLYSGWMVGISESCKSPLPFLKNYISHSLEDPWCIFFQYLNIGVGPHLKDD